MKNRLLTAAAVCAVLILCACEEPRATNTVPAYPFDTLHGNWIRIGNIGTMGVTKLKSYTKNGNEEWMEWTALETTNKLKCNDIKNLRPGLYTFDWQLYDESTSALQTGIFMSIQIAIESPDMIYMKTNSEAMAGGLIMTRVN